MLRLIRGWSQESLAEAASLDRAYLSGVERAERNVGIDSLDKLAKAFSITVDELLRERDPGEFGEHVMLRIRRSLSDGEIKEPQFCYGSRRTLTHPRAQELCR